jgi:hypothetical protein
MVKPPSPPRVEGNMEWAASTKHVIAEEFDNTWLGLGYDPTLPLS